MIPGLTAQPVPLRAGESDVLYVGASRVTLSTVLGAFLAGDSPEEIVSCYPALGIGDVYTVLGYYLSHRDEVDAYLAEQSQRAAKRRAEVEKRFPPAGVRERLLRRLEASRDARGEKTDGTTQTN